MVTTQPLAKSTNRITWTADDYLGIDLENLTVAVTITDPDGTVRVTGASMTHLGDGVYEYILDAVNVPKAGVYTVRIYATTSGDDPIYDATTDVGFRSR